MPDEDQAQTPATEEEQDTSAQTEAPQEDTATAENWEQRYNDLRPEFDRKSQQLAQYESVWETLNDEERGVELLRQVRPDLFEDDEEFEDEETVYDPRVDQLLQERQQAMQFAQVQAAQQAEHQHLDTQFDGLEKTAGREFEQNEIDAIVALARANPITEGQRAGLPNVEAAYKHLYEELFSKHQERYRESKQAFRAPGGAAAAKTEDLDDPQARAEYINRRMQDD